MTVLLWARNAERAAGAAPGRPARAGSEPVGPWPGPDLGAIVGPLVGAMTRTSRRILHDDALADDAIQETFLTYWTRAERPANPQAWLLRAVTLRSLHLARSARRRRDHEHRATLGRAEWSDRDDPARSLDHAELMEVLHEALAQLPAAYRAVFLLWAVEEMDYATIAATLHIPLGTVRSRLNRTRRQIRTALAGLDGKDSPQNLPDLDPTH